MAILSFSFIGQSQDSLNEFYGTLLRKGEVKFRFVETDAAKIAELGCVVSIDSRRDSLYSAYANQEEFRQFLALGYQPLRMEEPAPKAGIEMASTVEEMQEWNRYPTYQTYLDMMYGFAEKYSGLCRLDTIGFSVKGRLILCLKISDHVRQEEAEPGFFYSSSIHGDELTGFVLMLRLADYLLANYGTDQEVTELVDGMQIYINPLSNPDGAYRGSDNDVSGATRYNANNVDLNRNYPDFWQGSPGTIQKENQAMMAYVEKHDFVMSVNIHGGSDVLNFPWDGFRSSRKKHADYDWWREVSKRYVDTCRKVDNSAYRDVNADGYVDGGDWYVVNNGRQDYMNVYRHVREQTLEISVTKMPAASSLPTFWNINSRSLINYMKEAAYGIRGFVRDSASGEAVRAMVHVVDHDIDSSQVYSSAHHGMFFRPVAAGRYDLRFSAPGYRDKVVTAVEAKDFSVTECDVLLAPLSTQDNPDTLSNGHHHSPSLAFRLWPNPARSVLNLQAGFPFAVQAVYDVSGREIKDVFSGDIWAERHGISVASLKPGMYVVEVRAGNGKTQCLKFVRQ